MLGYDHKSFWEQTPHTLSLTFKAKRYVYEQKHNERMSLAWHTAALTREKKRLPRLMSLLVKPAPRRQTWQEQMQIMDAWSNVINARQK